MAVFVKVNYDTTDADRQLGASQEAIAKNYEKLGEIANEALKLDKIKDAFEGLKDASETWLPLLGDENEQLSGLIDKGLKLGEAGAKIGGFFGPWGAAIGAFVGGLSSLFAVALENEAELEKKAKAASEELKKQEEVARQVTRETEDMVDALNELDRMSLSGVTVALTSTREEIIKTVELIEKEQGSAMALIERWGALVAIQEGNVIEARNALLSAIGGGADKINEVLDRGKKSTADLKDEASKAKKEIEKLREDLGDLYQGLEDIHDENAAKEAVKATNAVLAAIDKQTAIYDSAQDEIEARQKEGVETKKKLSAEEKKNAEDAVKDLEEMDRKWTAYLLKSAEERGKQKLDIEKDIERQRLQLAEDAAQKEADAIEARNRKLAEDAEASFKAWQEARDKALSEVEETTAQISAIMQPFADVLSKSFDLIADNIAKGEKPLKGFSNELRGFIGDVLKAYAKKWGAQALGEVAEGISWSVSPIPGGRDIAAVHFASAQTFGLAAVAAGGAGILAGRNTEVPAPASGGGGASSGDGFSSSNPSLGGRDRGAPSQGGNISVTLAGNMFLDGDDRSLAKAGHRLGSAINASRRDLTLDTGVN
jgi:hypothetical protein